MAEQSKLNLSKDRIYLRDVRAVRSTKVHMYCREGIELVLNRQGITLDQFIKEGMSFEDALAMDNVLVTRVVKEAIKRQEASNGFIEKGNTRI